MVKYYQNLQSHEFGGIFFKQKLILESTQVVKFSIPIILIVTKVKRGNGGSVTFNSVFNSEVSDVGEADELELEEELEEEDELEEKEELEEEEELEKVFISELLSLL